MTTAECCEVIVDLVGQLSAARDDIAAFRILTQQAVHRCHALQVELDALRVRYHAAMDDARTSREDLRRYTAAAVTGKAA